MPSLTLEKAWKIFSKTSFLLCFISFLAFIFSIIIAATNKPFPNVVGAAAWNIVVAFLTIPAVLLARHFIGQKVEAASEPAPAPVEVTENGEASANSRSDGPPYLVLLAPFLVFTIFYFTALVSVGATWFHPKLADNYYNLERRGVSGNPVGLITSIPAGIAVIVLDILVILQLVANGGLLFLGRPQTAGTATATPVAGTMNTQEKTDAYVQVQSQAPQDQQYYQQQQQYVQNPQQSTIIPVQQQQQHYPPPVGSPVQQHQGVYPPPHPTVSPVQQYPELATSPVQHYPPPAAPQDPRYQQSAGAWTPQFAQSPPQNQTMYPPPAH